jgi:hypothetical protein
MVYGVDDRCSIPGKGKYFLFQNSFQTGSGDHPLSYSEDTENSRVGRSEREADSSPRPIDWVKNDGPTPPLPQMPSCQSA